MNENSTVETRSTSQKRKRSSEGDAEHIITTQTSIMKNSSTVTRLFELIRYRAQGHPHVSKMPSRAGCKLSPYEYMELFQRFREDKQVWEYARHTLKYDYLPSCQLLVIRTPSDLHVQFIKRITKEILDTLWTSTMYSTAEIAGFADSIRLGHDAPTCKFDVDTYGAHSPDAQFLYKETQYPGVVIEMWDSRQWTQLERLLHDYIMGSKRCKRSMSNIKAVLCFIIDAKTTKAARLCIARPRIERDQVRLAKSCFNLTNTYFRNEDGDPDRSPEGGLRLQLRDFIPGPPTGPREELNEPIIISAKRLCLLLHQAEIAAKK